MSSRKTSAFHPLALAMITTAMFVASSTTAQAQNQTDATASPAPSIWKLVNTPNFGTNNDLFAFSALSENDIWAVGQLVSLHFNGKNWKAIPMANANSMNGVVALSPNNVWAVGNNFDNNHSSSVIQHFDGKQWTIVSSPHLDGGDTLESVQAISAKNIFAVGTANADSTGAAIPLVEHFDGKKWTVVTTPTFSFPVTLSQLTIISASDMWAVGTSGDLSTTELPFAMHFDGTEWKQVSVPVRKGTVLAGLRGVTAISTNDVWAVGFVEKDNASAPVTLTEHWDGHAWKIVPSPNAGKSNGLQPENLLLGISAISTNDVWASGVNVTLDSSGTNILIEHWDGKRWSISKAPQPGFMPASHAVLAFPSGSVFVGGGTFTQNGGINSVVLHTTKGK